MSKSELVVVVGATGRQGGAVLRRLVRDGYAVRALTRNPRGAAANGLRVLGAEVVQGDLNDRASLVTAFRDAFGVFAVTDFWESGYESEVAQGRALVDAAKSVRVQHFVFSSVGGTDRTENRGITHFDSKRMTEQYLQNSALNHTIFRPVTFFENFITARYQRAICNGVFRFCIEPAQSFQMVAMEDVGAFVAKAFEDPSGYSGQCLELASDRFTMLEFTETLTEIVGRPVRYQYLPRALQWLIANYVVLTNSSAHYKIGPSLIKQFQWNHSDPNGGWNADIPALRLRHPGLMSMRAWVESVNWNAWREGMEPSRV